MKLLVIALALAALVNTSPPVLDQPDAQGFAQCPDESIIMLERYENGVAAYRQGSESPYAFVDRVNKEVYVYAFKKWYSIDEAVKSWPTLCEIPGGTGV